MAISNAQSLAILCATCGGDPRISKSCRACGGAGIGVPSPDGFLVWSEPLDEFTISMRKIRRVTHATAHVLLLAFSLLTLILFVTHLMRVENIATVATLDFWNSGDPAVTALWIGLLINCFLIFRLSEFTREAHPLPEWRLPKKRASAKEAPASAPTYRFEIAPHFSPEARDVLENAYRLAQRFHRTEVTPHALFAAALASHVGGFFMLRLGVHFDAIKHAIARVLDTDSAGKPPIFLSRDAKKTLALAYADARAYHRKYVSPIEIFLRSFQESPSVQVAFNQAGFPPEHVTRVAEWIRMQQALREDHERFAALAKLKPHSVMNRAMTARQTPLLDRFSEDLTLLAREGYLAATVGREREMEELLQAIESGRRSVALVGEAGSGKLALVEHLARRMVEEDVPPELFDRRLVSVNVAKVIAAGDPALAADRFLALLNDVQASGNIILVLQGIETLTGAGSRGPMDLAEILASELEKGYCIAVVTTTPRAWTQYLEQRSLAAKLIKIEIPSMGVEDTLKVLMAHSGFVEYQNKVFFSFAALEKAATLAQRYLHDIAAPENALSLIREAAVAARAERGEKTFVTAQDVATVVERKTHIPVTAVTENETSTLLNLETRLHRRVIGQNEAVNAVSQALRRARAELREGKRPIANFLFLGPTGVGKTELAKALAIECVGSEDAMIRLDMSEYQDASSIARMIGAPGDARGGLLTEAVRRRPFGIVLLDELEKAHADILNLFLQVMDDGRLTDGIGRTVDFTNMMLIATSNAGTQFIQDAVSNGTSLEQIKTGLLERELKGVYRPELLNRFDGVIIFKPLTLDEVTQIAWLLVNGIAKRLEEKGIVFRAEDAAIEELARAGFDPLFGARPLRRVIQERVDNGLADLLLRHAVARTDTVVLETGGALRVEKAPRL